MAKILVIDDEEAIRQILSVLLGTNGHAVSTSGDGHEALAMIRAKDFDVVLCDMRMTPLDGIQVLRLALEAKPKLKVILLTAFASVDTAREAMEIGAFSYLTKPWNLDELLVSIQRALTGETAPTPQTTRSAPAVPAFNPWEGKPWKSAAEAAAQSDAPALIQCVGMDPVAFARSLHDAGRRKSEPFVVLPCAALPEPVLAVQLHGCVRGAIDAIRDGSPGVFESAGTGTVLLDEISWMPHKLQQDFVELAAAGAIKRLGGMEDIPLAARILATTSHDPDELLAQRALVPAFHAFFAGHVLRIGV